MQISLKQCLKFNGLDKDRVVYLFGEVGKAVESATEPARKKLNEVRDSALDSAIGNLEKGSELINGVKEDIDNTKKTLSSKRAEAENALKAVSAGFDSRKLEEKARSSLTEAQDRAATSLDNLKKETIARIYGTEDVKTNPPAAPAAEAKVDVAPSAPIAEPVEEKAVPEGKPEVKKVAPKRPVENPMTRDRFLKENPDVSQYFTFDDATKTYKFTAPPGSSAERFIRIEDGVRDEHKSAGFYLRKNGESPRYVWNGETFSNPDKGRLKIKFGDKVSPYLRIPDAPIKTQDDLTIDEIIKKDNEAQKEPITGNYFKEEDDTSFPDLRTK